MYMDTARQPGCSLEAFESERTKNSFFQSRVYELVGFLDGAPRAVRRSWWSFIGRRNHSIVPS